MVVGTARIILSLLPGLGPGSPVSPFQADQPSGVNVPLFPLAVALLGLAAIVMVSVGALRLPDVHLRRPRRLEAKPRPHAMVTAPAEPPRPAPIFKKAPIQIGFPMIKPGMPDVWGVREKAAIAFRAEDRGLVGQREIPGLSAKLGDAAIPLVFYRGEARVERVFNLPQELQILVELKVKGERLPRRATRTLRIVDYRTEIAELFAAFKDQVARSVIALRDDATAWEIFDAILDAKPDASQTALREVVASFEEAKFSNHAVGRDTYEKMVRALRTLAITEV